MGRRAGPEGEEHAEERPGGDLRELVHLPDRVPLPDDWHPRLPRGGGDSDRLLHFGRDLQVSGWPDDLPDHHLQVPGRDEAWPVICIQLLLALRLADFVKCRRTSALLATSYLACD